MNTEKYKLGSHEMNQTQVKTQMLNISSMLELSRNERTFYPSFSFIEKVRRVRSTVEERLRQAQTYLYCLIRVLNDP